LVALSGEHDLSTLAQLEHQTRHVWAHCKVAVIDLAEVTFLDSSLINWLLRVEHALESAGSFTLSIVVGTPGCAAAKLFEQLRMSYVRACYATRPDAFMQAVDAADTFVSPARAAGLPGADMARARRAA
jgi:anti-anti-sigma regulatory factor